MKKLTFGKKLTEARKIKGLNQVELAERIGLITGETLKRTSISNYETETSFPAKDVLVAISKVLGIGIDKLLDIEPIEYQEFSKSSIDSVNETIEEYKTKQSSYLNKKNENLLSLLEELKESGGDIDKLRDLKVLFESLILKIEDVDSKRIDLFIKNKELKKFIDDDYKL